MQSQTTPHWYQCPYKVWKKSVKIYSSWSPETKRLRTDGHSKRFGGYDILPRHFFVAGYNKMTCAPSEDSGQPVPMPSLIRVFAVRMKKPWVLSYLLSAQRRLCSDWADKLIWHAMFCVLPCCGSFIDVQIFFFRSLELHEMKHMKLRWTWCHQKAMSYTCGSFCTSYLLLLANKKKTQ